ncbi:hypothetical protein Tco_1084695, partial [Tanacetum coccineum]
FEILERIGLVAYKLRLLEELNSVHDTFHVSNLKKCLADANLHVPLDKIKVDKTLRFIKESVEIMDREIRKLKRKKIVLVKLLSLLVKSRDEISSRRGYCDIRDLIRNVVYVATHRIYNKISHVISKDFMAFVLDKDRVGLLRFASAIIRPLCGLVVVVLMGQSDVAGWGIFLQVMILLLSYPAINKPAAVLHWLNHVKSDAEYIGILDADIIMRGPITPWEFKAAHGRPERPVGALANLATNEKCSMEVATFNRYLCFSNACLQLQARGSPRTGLWLWTSSVVVLYQKKKMQTVKLGILNE